MKYLEEMSYQITKLSDFPKSIKSANGERKVNLANFAWTTGYPYGGKKKHDLYLTHSVQIQDASHT